MLRGVLGSEMGIGSTGVNILRNYRCGAHLLRKLKTYALLQIFEFLV